MSSNRTGILLVAALALSAPLARPAVAEQTSR